jgi:hypothetical protein
MPSRLGCSPHKHRELAGRQPVFAFIVSATVVRFYIGKLLLTLALNSWGFYRMILTAESDISDVKRKVINLKFTMIYRI